MRCAHETGMDRVAIRRQQLHRRRTRFPIRRRSRCNTTAATTRRHSMALKAADYAGFEARRAAAAARGKLRGIGISTYIEACGIAPSAVVGSLGARAGLYEVAEHPGASDRQRHGLHRHAQPRPGPRDDAARSSSPSSSASRSTRSTSSTATPPRSRSAWAPMAVAASRVGGTAMVKAMDKIIAKGKKIAAHLMEASVDDIEFKDNKFTVAGTDKAKTLTDISLAAYVPHNYPIEELEPGLDETAFYDPEELHLPRRLPYRRGRDRPRHRHRRGGELHRGRRCRPRHQSDDRRGPGPGRRRAGHRPGAAGACGLRQAADNC